MAKVKFSALISEMRNKLNGSVFSKNRAGNFLRNKVTPVNPQSAAQQAVRASFGAVSSLWRGLNEAQVNAWNALASHVPYTDIFGDQKFLSGLQLHQKYNTNLASVNTAPISDAPVLESLPSSNITSVIAGNDTGDLSITFNTSFGSVVPVGMALVVFATPPMGVGISYAKSQLRKIGFLTNSAPNVSSAVTSLYVDKFGNAPIGTKIFFRAHLVSLTSGQNSVAGVASTVVFDAS